MIKHQNLFGKDFYHDKTTKKKSRPRIYPCLLKDLQIERINQVWTTDITYLPMAKGFAYLVAIIDLYSRRVMSRRLSNTMDASFCIEALEDAIQRFGPPEIFNTDQGSQFTSESFTSVLKAHGVKISRTARVDGLTTFLSSACGVASNMRRFI